MYGEVMCPQNTFISVRYLKYAKIQTSVCLTGDLPTPSSRYLWTMSDGVALPPHGKTAKTKQNKNIKDETNIVCPS